MQIQIIQKQCGGTEFLARPHRLHLGAQNAQGVDTLQFTLPAAWAGCAAALYLRRKDGTQMAPVPLSAEGTVTVDRRLTGCTGGQWMLAATGPDGYPAYPRPGTYDAYATLPTDGGSEDLPPTLYEQFVARVLESASSAASAAQKAAASASGAADSAADARAAALQTGTDRSTTADCAARAEAAASRAELLSPADGRVLSVNGKGGAVTLTAADVGALPQPLYPTSGSLLRIMSVDPDNGALSLDTVPVPAAPDATLTARNAPAEAKATGDALAAKADAETVNNALAAKADDADIRNALKEALAEKLGLHDTAEDSTKWAGRTLRLEHNTSDTWIPVFCEGFVDYVLKSEIIPGYAPVAAKLGQSGNPDIPMQFNWSGQNGQPTWLWGGNDGQNMYVWNPSNFSVNYANNAGNGVNSAGYNYIRFACGVQICWTSNLNATSVWTFPAAFSNTDYAVTAIPQTDDAYCYGGKIATSTRCSTTKCKVEGRYMNNGNLIMAIAIGRWY